MRIDSDYRNVSGGVYAILAFGILLLLGGIALPLIKFDTPVSVGVVLALVFTGLLLSLLATALIVVAKLYVRTKASEAFVRTGRGGLTVIQDGGAIVIPMIHEITRVSLQTMVLSVKREGGAGALITKDKLRADIEAQFYLCVKNKSEDIQAAARSLGSKMGDEEAVRNLIEDKLISALRNAASVRTLEELNSNREAFTREVEGFVKDDLAHNGLTLESVTISRLDQTDPKTLRADNIFDAQGLRTIAEITQKARTEKNALDQAGEQEREQQNVETAQRLFALAQQKAKAEAEQKAEIATINAAQQRIAQEKEIERDRAVAIATQQKEQAVQVATQQKEQAVQVATQQKEQAVQIAAQQKEQAVSVATQEKFTATAQAERAKAIKEAEKNNAEADREKAAQQIVTVRAQAEAERQKVVEVTKAEAEAQKLKVAAEQAANAAAYKTEKEAEAQKAAAEAQAEATRKNAEAAAAAQVAKARADAEATLAIAKAQAEGQTAVIAAEQAQAMIPINVKAREVEVEKSRVDVKAREVEVLQQELEAREQHGAAAQQFELDKLRIIQEAQVRIESAKTVAAIHGKTEVTVVSTAEDAAKMNQRYLQGLGLANGFGGFVTGLDDKTLEGAGDIAALLREVVRRLGDKTGGGPSNPPA